MPKEEVSDYYIKYDVDNNLNVNLSNLSTSNKELLMTLKELSDIRRKSAMLRKDFFEKMISIRLNLDKFSNHLPVEEFKKLEKNLKEMEKYQKNFTKPEKQIIKKVEKKKEIKELIEEEENNDDMIINEALESEKKELELLKQDLERISSELDKKE